MQPSRRISQPSQIVAWTFRHAPCRSQIQLYLREALRLALRLQPFFTPTAFWYALNLAMIARSSIPFDVFLPDKKSVMGGNLLTRCSTAPCHIIQTLWSCSCSNFSEYAPRQTESCQGVKDQKTSGEMPALKDNLNASIITSFFY